MTTIYNIDMKILEYFVYNIRNDFLDKVFPIITSLGNGGVFWIVTGLILLITKKYRKLGFFILTSIIVNTFFTNIILKPLIARTRPFNINFAISTIINKPKDYSFPSGHTSVSFAAATSIFMKYKKIGFAALILAGIIGISRLYLFVHFPSDVIVGAFIGIASSFISNFIFSKFGIEY